MLTVICCKTQEINNCQSNQEQETLLHEETTAPVQEDPLPGGFQQIPVDSEKALIAFEFLKKQLLIIHPYISQISIKSAALQLVAGMKIILVCNYKTIKQCTPMRTLHALIFIDIRGNKSIMQLNIQYGE